MLAQGGLGLSEDQLVCDDVPGEVDWVAPQGDEDTGSCGDLRLSPRFIERQLLECGLEDDSVPASPPPQSAATNYGEIVIKDSTDIHIGNKTFYNGAVTIKQFVFPPKGEEEVPRLKAGPGEQNGTLAKSRTHLCESAPDDAIPSSRLTYLKSPYVIVSGIAVLVAVSLLTVFLLVTFGKTAPISPEDNDVQLPENATARYVTRGEWFALIKTRYDQVPPLTEFPAPFVVIIHTAGSACVTMQTCSVTVKDIQADHLSRGWEDIGYNFLIGGDGYIYEGLGWNKKGSHTIPMNARSVGIAFIGNFMVERPPKKQLEAAQLLLKAGEETAKLQPNYTLLVQQQVIPTSSPGKTLVEEIKKWPHWGLCEGECAQLVQKYG